MCGSVCPILYLFGLINNQMSHGNNQSGTNRVPFSILKIVNSVKSIPERERRAAKIFWEISCFFLILSRESRSRFFVRHSNIFS